MEEKKEPVLLAKQFVVDQEELGKFDIIVGPGKRSEEFRKMMKKFNEKNQGKTGE